MATILTDNLNSYNNGDLNGQGSWSGSAEFDIQGTIVKEGAKAVAIVNPTGTIRIKKTGTAQTAGVQSCYMRVSNIALINLAYLELWEGAVYITSIYIHNSIFYGDVSGADLNLGTPVNNTWHFIQIEWRSSPSKQVRFQIDSGGWTDWYSPGANWTTNINAVAIAATVNTASLYWDYFAESAFIEQNAILLGTNF